MNAAIAVFLAGVTCWGLGLLAGYSMGRKQSMTRSQAATILAKASWAGRIRAGNQTGFFKTVNR